MSFIPVSYHKNLGCWNCRYHRGNGIEIHCIFMVKNTIELFEKMDKQNSSFDVVDDLSEKWQDLIEVSAGNSVEPQGHCDEWKLE
jgi:hypothetical protein